MSIYDTTGQLLSTGEYTTEIVRDTTILGERWFIDNAGSVSTNRDGETWTMRARVPYLTFTKTLGDSAFIRGDVWIKLVGTSDRIVVPAGEFTGYRYNEVHWKVSDEYAIYHIVPRKGVVKTVVRSMTLRGGTYIAYTTELVWTNVP